jgi:ferric-dicitrate binding protein FerR (iron transport regulator)
LSECADCRALLEAFHSQDAELRRAFLPRRRAAAAVAGSVVERLRADGRRSGLRTFAYVALAAAAGFAIGAMFFLPRQPPAAGPQVASSQLPDAQGNQRPSEAAGDASAKMASPQTPSGSNAQAPPVPQFVARLANAIGVAEALSGRAWQALEPGASIGPGEHVRTGAGVLCEMRTSEGSEVRLAEETEVLFTTNRSLILLRGRVWSSVEHDPVPYAVQIADVTVTAVGTKFQVEERPDGAVLTMVEGITRVSGGRGDALVPQGWSARITQAGIEQYRETEVLFATRWVNRLLVLKEPGNPELSSRLLDLLAYIGEGKMRFLSDEEIRQLGESCVAPLLSYVRSGAGKADPQRRLKAAHLATELAKKDSVYDLIETLPDESREVRELVAAALERITGENQGRAAQDWRQRPWSENESYFKKWIGWWDANKAAYPRRDSR